MTSGKDIVLQYVVPAVGGVISVLMFLSSMPAVIKAIKHGTLGDLNPVPYPAIVANCIGWVSYSFVITDGFVLGPNAPGVVIGLFYTMITMGLASRRSQEWMTAMMVAYACLLIIVGAVGAFRDLGSHAMRLLWGFTCNFILLTYYAAPLSTLWTVLKTRSAATINPLLALANALNGALWLAYGIAISDLFIAVPNGSGMLLSLVLIGCMTAFWKKDRALAAEAAAREVSEGDIGATKSTVKSGEEDCLEMGLADKPSAGLRARAPIQDVLTRGSAQDDLLSVS